MPELLFLHSIKLPLRTKIKPVWGVSFFAKNRTAVWGHFLGRAKTPADIQVVSKAFPFFRLASVLQTPPDPEVFGAWLVNAFYAGISYGTLYPTQAEETAERAFGGHG